MRTLASLLVAFACTGALVAQEETLVLDSAECAGMSGFRAHWNTPLLVTEDGVTKATDKVLKDRGGTAVWTPATLEGAQPGPLVFDALNRQLLVRFPGAAERINAAVQRGQAITKVELVLPFRDEELWPPGDPNFAQPDGYSYRANWGVDKLYRANRPRWHAVAHALRRPWKADPQLGPTFNAYLNGAGYWAKYGAQDEVHDRFPQSFGPTEVSYQQVEGRMDITPTLTDPAFGRLLGERLRRLSDCGFLLRKWETYDHRYFTGVYEWATATGGRGILLNAPRLEVTLRRSKVRKPFNARQVAVDLPALAAKLRQENAGGKPTAVMPSKEQLDQWNARLTAQPEWMPDWQWQRVRELATLAAPDEADAPFWFQFVPKFMRDRVGEPYRDEQGRAQRRPPPPEEVYALWMDSLIGRQPRGWSGFESAREMSQWYLYHDAMVAPAKDAIKRYWTAWLMPDRETAPSHRLRMDPDHADGTLLHPMADQLAKRKGTDKGVADTYYAKTGDWRGNKSFFRSGFLYTMSTQNFNTTAAAGALLAGAIVGSDRALADGRHGLEHYPARLWTWSHGGSQEHVDHYYYALTLSGNKVFADWGPTRFDRLLGQSVMAKHVEELCGAYHPHLRRFIAGASRTANEYVLATQDGLQFLLHTLSRSGALTDVGAEDLPGNMKPFGHEVRPELVARQTMAGPWAPEWVSNLVDAKPLPFEARHKFQNAWRTCYLGENYGLASADILAGRYQVMAVWRRQPKQPDSMRELTFLDVRYGFNETNFVNDNPGWIAQPGTLATLQQENKLLVVSSPTTWKGGFAGSGEKRDQVRSLQTSIALYNYQQPEPSWRLYVGGKRVTQLPATAKQGQPLALHEGVSYLGVIALPATDLGRDVEVTLEKGRSQQHKYERGKKNAQTFEPALVINNYNLRRDQPLAGDQWIAADRAQGGFWVELGDAEEYGSFEAFQKHLQSVKLTVTQGQDDTLTVDCRSGEDTLIATVKTNTKQGEQHFVARTLNGASPFPETALRDTTVTQQGRGRIEKNGAVLTADEERTLFLQTDPVSGTFAGWNPLPDLTPWEMTLPSGAKITADGRVSLLRVVAHPGENRLEIDHCFRPGQETTEDAAKALLLTGFAKPPAVELNGTPLTVPLSTGGEALVVPLG